MKSIANATKSLALGCALGTVLLAGPAQAISIPGADTFVTWISEGLSQKLVAKQPINPQDLCKKGKAVNALQFYKWRSLGDVKNFFKNDLSIRVMNGLLGKQKYTAAFGMLVCPKAGVADFDQSAYAKNARKVLGSAADDPKKLNAILAEGLVKGTKATVTLTCLGIGAGLVATEGGAVFVPKLASACGAVLTALGKKPADVAKDISKGDAGAGKTDSAEPKVKTGEVKGGAVVAAAG